MKAEQDPYYGRPECSNSDLSFLNKYWQPFQISYDIEKAQNFGTLLDCMITEPARVNYFKFTCAGVQYTREDFDKAERMKAVFFNDEYCRLLHANSDMQAVVVNPTFEINFEGYRFTLPFRMKADFDAVRVLDQIADLKTTNAKTEKEFMAQARAFEYNRQGAVYLDMKKTRRFMLIGISKHAPHPIWKIPILRGDDLYREGRASYEALAFQHHTYFQHLNLAA